MRSNAAPRQTSCPGYFASSATASSFERIYAHTRNAEHSFSSLADHSCAYAMAKSVSCSNKCPHCRARITLPQAFNSQQPVTDITLRIRLSVEAVDSLLHPGVSLRVVTLPVSTPAGPSQPVSAPLRTLIPVPIPPTTAFRASVPSPVPPRTSVPTAVPSRTSSVTPAPPRTLIPSRIPPTTSAPDSEPPSATLPVPAPARTPPPQPVLSGYIHNHLYMVPLV
jgi:hypothetical protein